MGKRRGHLGVRMLLAAALLVVLGLCAGAAVPAAYADDDDDNGDNGGGAIHICSGDIQADPDLTDDVVVQHCVITPADGTDEKCIQRSSAQMVEQRCEFEQTSSMANLRMTALQIHDPEGGPNGAQDATQVIQGTQTNLSVTSRRNSNFLSATQIADQCLGHGDPHEDDDGDWNDDDHDGDRDDDGRCEDEDEEDGDDEEDDEDDKRFALMLPTSTPSSITQHQEAHQTIDASQSAVNGKDEAYATQIQNLHERAANATLLDQEQNTVARANECGEVNGLADPRDANACFSIQQTSNGAKISKLWQVYNLSQSARNVTGGTQDQGDPFEFLGGLEHSFDQTGGTGTATQFSSQVERLNQHRSNSDGVTYHQFAGPRKGVGLQDDPNGRANMTQDVVVYSGNGPIEVGSQAVFMEILCSSDLISGTCTGTQRARTNDATYFDMQSDTSIAMVARCENTETVEGSFGECFPVEGEG